MSTLTLIVGLTIIGTLARALWVMAYALSQRYVIDERLKAYGMVTHRR